MKLHRPSLANKLGKKLARPMSWLACSPLLYTPTRLFDAYANFLIGRGSGTGWNLQVETRAAALRIKRPQPVLFDVGANLGEWTEAMLQQLPGARAYLFDASPGCQAVIQQKNLPNATLVSCAVGERAGRADFHFSSATDGSASLYERHDTPFAEKQYQTINVEMRTLDEMMESFKIDFVDFMKMDIEGHELFALRGARKALASRKIGALSFEFGCGNVNSRTFFRDYWDLLGGAGFEFWRVTPGGKNLPVTEYYEDLEYFRGATNYVAALKAKV